jgi:hypothetical protein
MPFGERQPLVLPEEMATAAGILTQCIMLLRAAGELSDEETQRMIAELGLKDA